jgi:transmembrane sensor
MESSVEIDAILLKYLREETLSPEEAVQLHHWLAADEDREDLLERIKSGDDWTMAELARLQAINIDQSAQRVFARLEQEGNWVSERSTAPVVALSRRVSRWRGYAAASVLVIVAGAGWWAISHRSSAPVANPVAPAVAADVRPGGNKAVLVLADGRQINLDSSANGILASQGNMKVSKLSDGQLAYNKSADEKPQPLAFNSLSTPKAGQFTLTLPDGSRVWLNNISTLRYPVSFTGADRQVELTGEAYFEIAKDAAHPFRVLVHKGDGSSAEGGSIEVLGTSFNIMAYNDEPAERTTLVDGSIKFIHAGHSALLKPEQQSVLDANGSLSVLPHANVQEVTAWKNGYFHFDHASLETTMRQLARWYDVDVQYQGHPAEQEFMGKIQRNLPLSAVLKGLENEQVHFKLEGRKLIVTP